MDVNPTEYFNITFRGDSVISAVEDAIVISDVS